jgi:glycosyltransferase involved in cell wall biosynthesis
MPSMLARHGLTLLHYTDNSATVATGIPFVVTVHDTMFLRPLARSYPRATARQRLVDVYKKWVTPRAARGALAVLTVSEFSRKCIVKDLEVPAERVHVTPEGVDPAAFTPDPRRRARKGPPTILVHAADDERKNLLNILRAFRLLIRKRPDATLMAMGMDERGLKRSGAARVVREWGLAPRLQMLGEVPRKLLRETYLKADVLLLASRWEGFGLPVLEAFACGVPVVASNTTALPEVAGNAALLVDPEDPLGMAEAVGRILGSPAFARSLVRRGFARARQFTWERTARLTLDVYRKAALSLEYDRQGRRISREKE